MFQYDLSPPMKMPAHGYLRQFQSTLASLLLESLVLLAFVPYQLCCLML